MAENHVGQIEYGKKDIIPNCTLNAPTAPVPVGEVVAVPTKAAALFYGVMNNADVGSTRKNADTIPVGVNQHFRVRKVAGTGKALAKFDYITFTAVSGTDYYAAEKAASGDTIYGQVMTAATATETTVHILGPYYSPGGNYKTLS